MCAWVVSLWLVYKNGTSLFPVLRHSAAGVIIKSIASSYQVILLICVASIITIRFWDVLGPDVSEINYQFEMSLSLYYVVCI